MTMTLKLVVVQCCANEKVVAWNVLISELGEAPWWLGLVLLHAKLKNDRKAFFSPPSKPSSQGSDVFLLPNQWKYVVKLRPSKALHSSVPDDRFEVGYMSNPQVVPHGSLVRNCLSTII